MAKFIPASEILKKKESVNIDNVNKVITIINKSILAGDSYVNTAFDNFSDLNDAEFEVLIKLAKEAGWNIRRFEDNYQSVTYEIII